jgi:hypothetical protein
LDSKRGSAPSATEAREWRPICKYCGMPIDHDSQPCAALDNGVCRP